MVMLKIISFKFWMSMVLVGDSILTFLWLLTSMYHVSVISCFGVMLDPLTIPWTLVSCTSSALFHSDCNLP